MNRTERDALLSVLLAAALFGSVAPVAKTLLSGIAPVTLAGLFYLGAGLGLGILRMGLSTHISCEAAVSRGDLPWIIVMILSGGVVGPILLMFGLSAIPAGTASLLLNGELVMTALIAWLFFHEPLNRRMTLAILTILVASIVLTVDPAAPFGYAPAALLIVAACFCWGIDNNATGRISGKDPAALVIIKGLGAAAVSFLIAIMAAEPLPPLSLVPGALIAGMLGYGCSILFFVRAIRILGAARTGSLFAAAPFIGVVVSFLVLGEVPGLPEYLAIVLMASGAWLIVTERHGHLHVHAVQVHDHRHTHPDSHHDHEHPGMKTSIDHAHPHQHEACTHEHPHTPDLHHCHEHDRNVIALTGQPEEEGNHNSGVPEEETPVIDR